MKELLLLLSDIGFGCVRVVVCQYLICRLLLPQKLQKNCIATGAAGAAAIAVSAFVTHMSYFGGAALEVFLAAFCVVRLQNADMRMSLFVSVFYKIAVSFWQFLLSSGIGVLSVLSADFFGYGAWNGYLADWLVHIALAVLAGYLAIHQDKTGKDIFRIISGVVLTGFFAVLAMSEQTVLEIPEDTLDMWLFLSVLLLMAVLAFNMNRQYEVEKELARLKSEQAELLERDYNMLNNAYAVNAKLFHDFHNHIGALRRLLLHEKYLDAVQYLDELQAPLREQADTVRTGDEVLDYLINSKAAAAAEDKISFQAQVEFPRNANIRSADLCTILGNLLDNALEAVRQMPASEQRFIRLAVRRINQMLVVKVENPFYTAPVLEDGLFRTTKTGGLHGWGLKSAQTAAEKYDGMVQTAVTDGIFRAVVTLAMKDR